MTSLSNCSEVKLLETSSSDIDVPDSLFVLSHEARVVFDQQLKETWATLFHAVLVICSLIRDDPSQKAFYDELQSFQNVLTGETDFAKIFMENEELIDRIYGYLEKSQ